MRPIPEILIRFLERVEGQRNVAYRDSGGVLTVGVGHTGPNVKEGSYWTQDAIDGALRADLALAQKRLLWAIGQTAIDRLNAYQYAALLSFVFNEGEKADWEIWSDIRCGRLDLVPSELARFELVKDRIVLGLVNRRKAEIALWNGQDPLCKAYPLNAA
jgi:lysozyme